jgi:copper homeostasis protein
VLIEAAVESLDAALAAAEGGAHRIELCVNLAEGGTTPPLDLLNVLHSRLEIPIFVLVRPRAGDFVYTDDEFGLMLDQIRGAKAAGARGIVSGALSATGEVHESRTRRLLKATRPLPFTFHRAFDMVVYASIDAGLETLIALGVDRVLTSRKIKELVAQARGRITVVAGGGINASNAARIVRETGVREIHFSVKDAQKVRDVLESL